MGEMMNITVEKFVDSLFQWGSFWGVIWVFRQIMQKTTDSRWHRSKWYIETAWIWRLLAGLRPVPGKLLMPISVFQIATIFAFLVQLVGIEWLKINEGLVNLVTFVLWLLLSDYVANSIKRRSQGD